MFETNKKFEFLRYVHFDVTENRKFLFFFKQSPEKYSEKEEKGKKCEIRYSREFMYFTKEEESKLVF